LELEGAKESLWPVVGRKDSCLADLYFIETTKLHAGVARTLVCTSTSRALARERMYAISECKFAEEKAAKS